MNIIKTTTGAREKEINESEDTIEIRTPIVWTQWCFYYKAQYAACGVSV